MKKFLLLTGIVFCSLTSLAEQHFLCKFKKTYRENDHRMVDYLLISLDSDNQLERMRATATADYNKVMRNEDLTEYNYGVQEKASKVKPKTVYFSIFNRTLSVYALNPKVSISLPTQFVGEVSEGLLQTSGEADRIILCQPIDKLDPVFQLFY